MTQTIKKFNIGFTQISNNLLTNPNLSLKAKAVYAYLFSKPDGWEFHINVMKQEIKEGSSAIYSAIKELIDNGYIVRHQQNENGKFGGIIYEFSECAINKPYAKTPCAENPHADNLNTNNTDLNNNNNSNNNSLKIYIDEDHFGEYAESLKLWVDYKKQKGKPLKKMSVDFIYKKMLKLSNENPTIAKKIVEEAISNGWQTIYALKSGFATDENGIPY